MAETPSNTPAFDEYLKSSAEAPASAAQPPSEMTAEANIPHDAMMNVVNPMGEIVSVPAHEVVQKDLFSNGYSPAPAEDIQELKNQRDYGGPLDQLNTAIRGYGNIATMGAFPLIERTASALLGQDYDAERVAKTNEANPLAKGLGMGAGLVGPGGVIKAVEQGAEALIAPAVEKIAPYVPALVAKIGSATVKGAVENVIVSGIDEISKLNAGDPRQNVDTALADLKFSALLGGGTSLGLGIASPIFKAGTAKVGNVLNAIKDRLGGIEGQTAEEVKEAVKASGIEPSPVMKSVLSKNEGAIESFKDLRQSPSPAGLQTAKAETQYRQELSNGILDSFGHTPESFDKVIGQSEAKSGERIGNILADEFEQKVAPLAREFEELKVKKAGQPLVKDQLVTDPLNPYANKMIPGTTSQISDELSQLAQREGWTSDSDAMKVLNRTIKNLPEAETIGDLTKQATRIGKENFDTLNPSLNRDVQQIIKVIREGETNATMSALAEEAPGLVERHQLARKAWAEVSDLKEALQSKLNLKGGSYNSNEAFIKNIRETSAENAEKLLRKVTKGDDVYLSKLLSEQFPTTAREVQNHQLNELFDVSTKGASAGEKINPTRFFSELDRLSPEMKQALIPQASVEKLEGIRAMFDHLKELNKDRNFSNTGPTGWRLFKNMPGTALAMVSALTGHNPAVSGLIGLMTETVGRNAPDAMKLSMLKFLGSSQPVEAAGFKTMVDYFHHLAKGEAATSEAVKNLFKAGREVAPQAFSSEKERSKMDQQLLKLQTSPETLLNMNHQLGHYMPEHQTALAEKITSVSQYLNSLRPQTGKALPLDAEPKPTKIQTEAYHQALDLAAHPLSILQKVKDNTLTAQDMTHFRTMYPGLFTRLQEKVTTQMAEAVNRGDKIPYGNRMSLSLFLGQPLDSTMTPQAIQMLQTKPVQTPSQQQDQHAKHSMTALNKLSANAQTPGQAREAQRLSR